MAIEDSGSGKALIASTTFWGSIISTLPLISEAANQLIGTGLLPPQVAVIVAASGAVISVLGRIFASEPITGVFTPKKECDTPQE